MTQPTPSRGADELVRTSNAVERRDSLEQDRMESIDLAMQPNDFVTECRRRVVLRRPAAAVSRLTSSTDATAAHRGKGEATALLGLKSEVAWLLRVNAEEPTAQWSDDRRGAHQRHGIAMIEPSLGSDGQLCHSIGKRLIDI